MLFKTKLPTFEGTAKMSYLYIYEMLVASNETVYKEIESVQSIIKKKEFHSLSIKNKVANIQNKQKNNRKLWNSKTNIKWVIEIK